MRKWLALLLGCLALGLVTAGCGGDDDGDEGGGGSPPAAEQSTQEEATAGGDSGGGSTEVTIKDFAFDPADVKVKTGDTVTWTNEDSVGHDVTADSFKSGEPGGMGQGDTFEYTFKEAGSFDYICSVHPNMKASVTVE